MPHTPVIEVVAALIRVGPEALLIAKKATDDAEDSGLADTGIWEFPGGKVEPQETHHDALVREIEEELGVTIRVGAWFHTETVSKQKTHLKIAFYWADILSGVPTPRVHSVLQIVTLNELRLHRGHYGFHHADSRVLEQLFVRGLDPRP